MTPTGTDPSVRTLRLASDDNAPQTGAQVLHGAVPVMAQYFNRHLPMIPADDPDRQAVEAVSAQYAELASRLPARWR
jgi:hypothetical protein